jgi:hypothetical protein
MNILCYNIEKGLMEAIAMRFLPRGFKFYTADNVFDLKKVLFSKGIKLIIVDITSEKNKDDINVQFLKWISGVDQKNEFKKVVISRITDEYSIRRLMELGILAFISKKNQTSVILDKLEAVLEKVNSQISDARKHVRVTPDKSENPSAVFYIGKEKVIGTIINISMGGVLIQVKDDEKLIPLSKDQEIPRVQLSLNNRKIIVNSTVVVKKKNLLALKYSSISETYKEGLSKYIFQKISNA